LIFVTRSLLKEQFCYEFFGLVSETLTPRTRSAITVNTYEFITFSKQQYLLVFGFRLKTVNSDPSLNRCLGKKIVIKNYALPVKDRGAGYFNTKIGTPGMLCGKLYIQPSPPVQPPFHVPLKSPDHQRIEFVYTFSHGMKNVCVYPLIKAAKTMGTIWSLCWLGKIALSYFILKHITAPIDSSKIISAGNNSA
jgi:hypothetical protein